MSQTEPIDVGLTDQQISFYRTFGFLQLEGMFRDRIDDLQAGFDEVFERAESQFLDPANPYHRARDPQYAERTRELIPGFIDRSDKLQWLRDDPRVLGIARALLGDDFVYAESDGNIMNCDVLWHIDAYGALAAHEHIKLFFYLDPLHHDAGALRMIPGSHLTDSPFGKLLRKHLTLDPDRCVDQYGIGLDEVPAWSLEVEPGDLIVGNFRTVHASFNGQVGRRLFTVNFGARANDAADAA
jgi:hypothetical protein